MLSNDLEKVEGQESDGVGEDRCDICRDRSSGYHYGVLSCEGCKGFFRRSVQKSLDGKCKIGGNCKVTIATRRRCPPCRFNKCLAVGMQEHCLLTELQCKARGSKRKLSKQKVSSAQTKTSPAKRFCADAEDSQSNKSSYKSAFVSFDSTKCENSQSFGSVSKQSPHWSTSSQQSPHWSTSSEYSPNGSASQVSPHWPSGSQLSPHWSVTGSHSDQTEANGLMDLAAESSHTEAEGRNVDMAALLDKIILFFDEDINLDELELANRYAEGADAASSAHLKKIYITILASKFVANLSKHMMGFDEFSSGDQISLIKSSIFGIMALRVYRGYDITTDSATLPDSKVYTEEQLKEGGMGDSAASLFRFCRTMASMEADPVEVALMTCICLFSESSRVRDLDRVQEVQSIYSRALAAYCNLKSRDGCTRFARLIMKIISLRELNSFLCSNDSDLRFQNELSCEAILTLPKPLQQYFKCVDTTSH